MKEVYLLLGSNRGDRDAFLSGAREMIVAVAGELVSVSSVYETSPWGFNDEVAFLNQVVEINTPLEPDELMQRLLTIEARLGRIRPPEGCGCGTGTEYGGRTIDIDLLFYGPKMIFTDHLMVPHPRLHERRFTLVPLAEVAPGFVHPVLKRTMTGLLADCRDAGTVKKYVSGKRANPGNC